MFDLPQRVSLPEQTAKSIRKAISDGAWSGPLPSERRLCDIFKVSRPTIRAALQFLAADGWLETRDGRRNRLSPGATRGTRTGSRLVVCVTHVPMTHWTPALYQAFSDIRARLAAIGFSTEVVVIKSADIRADQRKIETFLQQNPVFCCILLSIKYELQRWFATLTVPALVIGSCDPTVRMPSFEVDMQSSCRHAVGVFLRLGHRHLALLVPDTGRGGDLASEVGFMEGIARAPARYNLRSTVVKHGDTPASLLAKLQDALTSGSAPTAWLVAIPQNVYTLMFFLQRRGLRIPEDVSIISRDQDPYFRFVSPAIAHYDFTGNAYGRRLTRLMLKLVREGQLPPERKLIELEFFEGGTLGPAGA